MICYIFQIFSRYIPGVFQVVFSGVCFLVILIILDVMF